MHEELFTIGNFTVHSYGVMIAVGFIVGLIIADRRAKKYGLDSDFVWSLAIVCLISGVVGAKLLFYITEIKSIIANPKLLLDFSNGFVIYGSIIAALIAMYFYCKKKKRELAPYLDLLVPSVAVAQGIGRIGCFLAGCCYGRATDCPIGVVFPSGSLAPSGIPLIPTQLFMAGGDFIIAAALLIYARKKPRGSMILTLYIALYAVGRFIIEIFRDDPRGSVGALSTSQFISIFMLVFAVFMYIRINKKKDSPQEKEEEKEEKTQPADD